ncbi:MAG TPA: marine proteobacterial sortase target protein [Burkholderiales bacterium]|nr:marine proteobacterial sortase target protein [Burkholderiales bacterium]
MRKLLILVIPVLVLATPAHATQGGLVLRAEGRPAVVAPLVSTDVTIRIAGPVARARVVQSFRNPESDWYEGVYVFPLPESGAVDRLRMQVGERVIEGEIRERGAARATYAEARAAGQHAALLDQERPNLFTTQVANIGPQETVMVELEYQQVVRYDAGRFSLRFPMVVGPRYIPAAPMRVADGGRITPPVMRPGSENGRSPRVAIRVSLDAGVPLAAVESAYHAIHVDEPSAQRREITLADGLVAADRDFELAWAAHPHDLPQAAWFTEEKDGRHYGVLMVLPPAATPATRLAREVVFVLDTSGSMAGASIRQAKQALLLALARLQPQDRFDVIEFNSNARPFFGDARAATRDNLAHATQWVESLEARGGTEIAVALQLALDSQKETQGLRQVIFLTDGAVGNEAALFRLLRERLGDSRLFTVGIGSAPNSHFMTQAARLGRGTFTYIGRIEEVAARMGELFAKLEAPVLKGLELRWPQSAHVEAWPARLPDLYAGEPLVVAAALDRLEGEVLLAGERDGRRWEARIALADSAAALGMGGLWAREKVAALMASVREGTPEAEVRARVIELASAHRLVTKYTSFVAVDKTPARPADESLKTAAVPTLLPAGWEYDKVFGELPQGSTGSRLALVLGFTAALLGAVLLRRKA